MRKRYVPEKKIDSILGDIGPQVATSRLRGSLPGSLREAVHVDHHHHPSVLRGAKFSERSIGIFARNGAYRCHSGCQHFCPHRFPRLVCRADQVA